MSGLTFSDEAEVCQEALVAARTSAALRHASLGTPDSQDEMALREGQALLERIVSHHSFYSGEAQAIPTAGGSSQSYEAAGEAVLAMRQALSEHGIKGVGDITKFWQIVLFTLSSHNGTKARDSALAAQFFDRFSNALSSKLAADANAPVWI